MDVHTPGTLKIAEFAKLCQELREWQCAPHQAPHGGADSVAASRAAAREDVMQRAATSTHAQSPGQRPQHATVGDVHSWARLAPCIAVFQSSQCDKWEQEDDCSRTRTSQVF